MLPIKIEPIDIEPIEIKPTIEDLQVKTVDELKEILTADMTKRDLLIIANDGSDVIDEMESTYDKAGREIKTTTTRDIETNEIISVKTVTYTLYPKGEVDEITIIVNDGVGKEISRKVIKHYTDERQPTVTEIRITKI